MRFSFYSIFLGILTSITNVAFAQEPVIFDTSFELNGNQTITSKSQEVVRAPFKINLLTDGESSTEYRFGTYGSSVYINDDTEELMIGYDAFLRSTSPDVSITGGRFNITQNSTKSRIGLETNIFGNGGIKYGVKALVQESGEVNYGIYAEAKQGENNYGIAAYASGGALNYAGFFGGEVKVEGNLSADSLSGDGSNLSNLPMDEDWQIKDEIIYNSNNKIAIGADTGIHQLTITNGNGQLINLEGSGPEKTPLTIQLLENGVLPTYEVVGTAGSFVNIDVDEPLEVAGYKSVVRSQDPSATAIGGKFTVLSDGIGNRGGVYGSVSGIGGNKYGVTGISEGAGELNVGLFSFATNAKENIGVYGAAFGGDINYAGKFDGDVKTSGKTETGSLVVGDTSNTKFSAMQGGTFIIGPDKTSNSTYDTNDENELEGFAEVTVTFPQAFQSPPILIVTPSIENGQSYDDSYSVTTKSITNTGAVLNVYRLDSSAFWGQSLEVDWFGFSK